MPGSETITTSTILKRNFFHGEIALKKGDDKGPLCSATTTAMGIYGPVMIRLALLDLLTGAPRKKIEDFYQKIRNFQVESEMQKKIRRNLCVPI